MTTTTDAIPAIYVDLLATGTTHAVRADGTLSDALATDGEDDPAETANAASMQVFEAVAPIVAGAIEAALAAQTGSQWDVDMSITDSGADPDPDGTWTSYNYVSIAVSRPGWSAVLQAPVAVDGMSGILNADFVRAVVRDVLDAVDDDFASDLPALHAATRDAWTITYAEAAQ